MGRIYSKASGTLAWLGQFGRDLGCVARLLEPLHGRMESDTKLLEQKVDLYAILSLLRMPFFERRWVVQEILLSRDVHFHCGGQILHWSALYDLTTILQDPSWKEAIFGHFGAADIVKRTNSILSQRLQPRHHYEPLSYLILCLNLRCSDARDLVYSLIALCRPTFEFRITYGETTEQVFRRLALATLETGDLGILHCVNKPGNDSFVPDWRDSLKGPRLGGPGCAIFSAGLNRGQRRANASLATTGAGKPCVTALKYQTVSHVVPSLKDDPKNFFSWLVDRYSQKPAETHREALAETLVAGARPQYLDMLGTGFMSRADTAGCLAVVVERARMIMDEYDFNGHQFFVSLGTELRRGEHTWSTLAEARVFEFWQAMTTTMWVRSMFLTEDSHFGPFIGPTQTRPEDEVHIILGAETPFILRPATFEGNSDYREVIGECYVHGIMDGELFDNNDWVSTMTMVPLY